MEKILKDAIDAAYWAREDGSGPEGALRAFMEVLNKNTLTVLPKMLVMTVYREGWDAHAASTIPNPSLSFMDCWTTSMSRKTLLKEEG